MRPCCTSEVQKWGKEKRNIMSIKIKSRLKDLKPEDRTSSFEPSAEEVKELEKIIKAQVDKFGLFDPLDIEPAPIFQA